MWDTGKHGTVGKTEGIQYSWSQLGAEEAVQGNTQEVNWGHRPQKLFKPAPV